MNYQTTDVIVIEGRHDEQKLVNLLKAEYIITNGLDVPRETLSYLSKVIKFRRVILLLDDDCPGAKIRQKLQKVLPGAINLVIPFSNPLITKKFGIAETSPEILIEKLKQVVLFNGSLPITVSLEDIYALKLMGHPFSKEYRKRVSEYYKLPLSNAKTLFKRLNGLQISKGEIQTILKS